MDVIYKKSNALFKYENDVAQICNPIFDLLNLKYYSYGRFYNDGRCILLSTNKNVFLNHFQKGYKLTVAPPKNLKKNCSEIFNLISVKGEMEKIIEDEYNLFDHGSMIDYIKFSKDFYEMFCFVSKKDANEPVNSFLNSTDNIKVFSKDFLKSANTFIKESSENIIQLPKKMIANIESEEVVKYAEPCNIFYNGRKFFLSKRQITCLSLLTLGKTSKEIGKELDISNKTVDFHIGEIKNKLKCSKKSDLYKIALENRLHEIFINFIKSPDNQ